MRSRDGDAPSPARRPVGRGPSASLPRSGPTGGARDCRAPQGPHGAGRSPPACRSAAPRPAGCLRGGGAWERGLLSSASRAGRSPGQCAVPGAGAARGVLPGPLLQGSTAPGSCAPDLPPPSPPARTLVPGASQWPQTVRSQTAELTIMRDVKTARGTLTRPQLLVTLRSGAGHTVAVTFGSVVLTYDILNVELPNSSRL